MTDMIIETPLMVEHMALLPDFNYTAQGLKGYDLVTGVAISAHKLSASSHPATKTLKLLCDAGEMDGLATVASNGQGAMVVVSIEAARVLAEHARRFAESEVRIKAALARLKP